MERLEQLESMMAAYVSTVDELMRKRKPGEGILGMGGGPQDAPCHEQFDQQVQALTAQWCAEGLSSTEAGQLVACLLNSEDAGHNIQCAQLTLVAVHRHTLPLIPLLSADSARQLLTAYTKRYPLFKRFPAQKQVIQALKQQAK